ncbi:MAG: phosphoribosylamine--glycine ligase [Comamonadaceae bacterium]|nr:MAG: phosphoribosylamine--glycine ligase [Comamonadaceae bacterium]
MRVLGIGESCELGALYWRLARAGHDVRVFIQDPAMRDVHAGLVRQTTDWRAELGWLRGSGAGDGPDDALVLFECASHGAWQDELRAAGFQVIGGSGWGDRVESDRAFGQQVLRQAATHTFDSHAAASAFLAQNPGRYVLKLNGAEALRTRNYVGQLDDGRDLAALLHAQQQVPCSRAAGPGDTSFVLMAHVQGIEVGVGAYFNGHDFLRPALLDWEHKHFFAGEQGELTGEMGTIVSYRGAATLFERTLGRLLQPLREARHCGWVNLNLIVNAQGIWPLEFTSRFGYPGYAICGALHRESWDRLFLRMLRRDALDFVTHDGFACGVVLSVPPFPYTFGYDALSKGLPLCARDTADTGALLADENLHFCEVRRSGAQLLASGASGYIGVATGIGAQVADAQRAAYAAAHRVVVPNLRYRHDIGDRVAADLAQLTAWGHVTPEPSAA